MLNIDFHKIPHQRLIIVILFLFASIFAPFWFIFQFNKVLFDKTNLLTLILLSFSAGFPLSVLNTCLAKASIYLNSGDDEENWVNAASIGVYVTIYNFYFPCVITYFDTVSLKDATEATTDMELVEIGMFIIAGIIKRIIKSAKKKPSLQEETPVIQTPTINT